MFKSKIRPINYSQYEHGRLAGTLAWSWGNEQFARPPLDFQAFANGVTLHDWGYGILDNLAIGEASDESWLAVVRKGLDKRYNHPVTSMIVRLHIRRLLLLNRSPQRESLINEIDEYIAGNLEIGESLGIAEPGAEMEIYQRTDKITQLCDMISFDFCFESPRQRTLEVFARFDAAQPTAITYEIRPRGEVLVDPWPFSRPEISGILYAFYRQGYPERLQPFTVPFMVKSFFLRSSESIL